jgi:hypothetical protein
MDFLGRYRFGLDVGRQLLVLSAALAELLFLHKNQKDSCILSRTILFALNRIRGTITPSKDNFT